ncbi:DEAD/DEAH box helicase [Terrisporobacter sp.]|uniref:DEAD/DEAH box helicase n=1 Tax=Terrisporobacter sp. TaxID=1965305 RepID=UPI0039961887
MAILKEMEIINYSIYNSNISIDIDRYISEHETILMTMLTRSLQGETNLLIAPTGSGKTYSIINMLKKVDDLGQIKSIFIVPNSINVEQIKIEYKIPGAWGDIPVLPELEKGNVVVMTWDKFIQLDGSILKDYIVVLDEVHQTLIEMFRLKKINKLYENLATAKGQIHITATPNKLNFNNYDFILEYKQNNQTKYNVKLYDKVCDDTIRNIIENSKKFALLKDDTNYLNFIKENSPNKKIDVITSNTRNLSKAYKEIVTKSTIKKFDGICNTSVLMAGVNIYEPGITDIIIVEEKDIAAIKQYVSRFRDLKEVNVHIFNKYQEEESKIYDIEWQIEKISDNRHDFINYYNSYQNKEFEEISLDIEPIRLNDSQEYYWNSELCKYTVNEIGIRNTCYTRYYSKADIQSFKVLLGEYFKEIEIVEIKETDNIARKIYNQISKEEKEAALALLEKEKSILVGAVEIISNKITTKTENYLNNNEFNIDDLKKELENKNIDKYIQIGNIAKTINLYTKYVIENRYNYNLAWCIALKGNRSRGKFFSQLNNIIYREIENKYPELMRYVKIEDKLYDLIVKTFTPGKSYTEEHLKIFCEAFEMTISGVKITTNKLGELLAQIYNIESKKYKECPGLDFLFNKIYNPIPGQNKRINVYTIKNYLTLEDVIEQNKLDELSLKVLKNLLGERIREIELDAKEINNKSDLFVV